MLVILGGCDRNMQLFIQPYRNIPCWRRLYRATQYGIWYESRGKNGWEPPEAIARIQDIYDENKVCTDERKRIELMGEILDFRAKNP